MIKDGARVYSLQFMRKRSRSLSPRRRKSRSPATRRHKSRSPRNHRRQRSRSTSLSPIGKSPGSSIGSKEQKGISEKNKLDEEEKKRIQVEVCYKALTCIFSAYVNMEVSPLFL
ncbi:hypothetical protein AABB24_022905 [Solanum stoloniferum]|uniref:Uncharacterized protein n=1 Tax=Solanum stoloniferum TaxID=62892 RepID=A0ABD2T1N1_9SOLN